MFRKKSGRGSCGEQKVGDRRRKAISLMWPCSDRLPDLRQGRQGLPDLRSRVLEVLQSPLENRGAASRMGSWCRAASLSWLRGTNVTRERRSRTREF